jgi:peroxiredoxin
MASWLLGLAAFSLWRDKRRLEAGGAYEVPDFEPPLQVGTPLPKFTVRDVNGREVDSRELTQGQSGILVFVSATCGPCHALLPELARWRDLLGERLAVHVLSAGAREANLELAEAHNLTLFLDAGADAAQRLRVFATPSAVEYDSDGRIASDPTAGSIAIEALLRSALKRGRTDPLLRS